MKPFFALILFTPFAVLADETNIAPALLPAYDPISPPFWEEYEVAIIVAGIAVVIFAALAVLAWRWPKAPVRVPPEVEARRALAALASRPENAQTLGEISRILRGYLGAVLGVPATEMTTAEIAAKLPFGTGRDGGLSGKVGDFLRECDVRKFAPDNALPPLNAVERAQELITAVVQALKPPPMQPR